MTVSISGNKIPLYGSGASLSSSTGAPAIPVPLKLNFVVKSRGYVLGKLVKPKFNKKIECKVVFDSKKHNVAISLKNSCTYDWMMEQSSCGVAFGWRWVQRLQLIGAAFELVGGKSLKKTGWILAVVTLCGLLVRNIDLIFYFFDLFVFDLLLKVGCQIVHLLVVYIFL